MTKLERLQKEFPEFELSIRPTSKMVKEAYEEDGYKAPERMLVFVYKSKDPDLDFAYSDYVSDFDLPISSLRRILNRWVSKI